MINQKDIIKNLDRKIKNKKMIRDAYSFLGHSKKVQENDKEIFELETKLIKLKLDSVK
jgi:hypothetical protein